MKIALIILGALVALIIVVEIIGAMLPKAHTATRSAVIRKQPRDVYAIVRDLASTPEYEMLEAVPEGTRLTITENGEVYNPIFRFLSKFVFGHTKTMDNYLAALQKR